MTITITLPEGYDFPTADECALHMTDATTALERRLKPKVEHGLIKQAEADHKLHLYRSITGVLDAVLAAMEDTELHKTEKKLIEKAEAEAAVPSGAAKPSQTTPETNLTCVGCGKASPASEFLDGRKCPVVSLQADFFSCPDCGGFDIQAENQEDKKCQCSTPAADAAEKRGSASSTARSTKSTATTSTE